MNTVHDSKENVVNDPESDLTVTFTYVDGDLPVFQVNGHSMDCDKSRAILQGDLVGSLTCWN